MKPNINTTIIFALVLTIGALACCLQEKYNPLPKSFTIEKTSDSEWQVSQTNYPDTTIRDTVLMDSMVLYPTTHYLRVLR